MKKIVIVLLVVASAIVTNASAAAKTQAVNSNLLAKNEIALNSKTSLNKFEPTPTYYVLTSNGNLYLLTLYDNGNSELTWIGFIPDWMY